MFHNCQLVCNSFPHATSMSLDKVYICALEEECSFIWFVLIMFIILIIPIVLYIKLTKFTCLSFFYMKGEENASCVPGPYIPPQYVQNII